MQREIRYIVIKRKHLTDGHERHLLGYLTDIGVDTIESVVVEHDWPEYEAVWDMIEARVDGKPSRIATLEAQLAEAGENIRQNLVELERINHTKATDFNMVRQLIVDNRATLSKIGGGDGNG